MEEWHAQVPYIARCTRITSARAMSTDTSSFRLLMLMIAEPRPGNLRCFLEGQDKNGAAIYFQNSMN